MSTKVEKRILVGVPVSTAYNQWIKFEDFPHFMGGVESVKQLSDDRLEWVAHIAGVRRHWEAKIVEQVPDRKIAWRSTEGSTNAGSVEFQDAGGGRTSLVLTLEYQPQGVVEKAGDLLHVVTRQAESDLKKFKKFIEHEGYGAGNSEVPESGTARREYSRFAHPFDQTNGLIDFEGESDETADGDHHSSAERKKEAERNDRYLPPLGGDLGPP